ncbi:uncharacterized protein LOC134653713 [Cydia amplana]|uniref:uncharacterized protein LOC134653713 n=1 Tax=Cydia amplana TaxID=1869771 RepID=UPI002FE5D418
MSARSRRLVRMATKDKDGNHKHEQEYEQRQASDLDESQERIADQMQQIFNDNIFLDDSTPESEQELPRTKITLPARRISETTSESESSLFGGDFSDNDPTYHPDEEDQQRSPGNHSDDDGGLITLQDLLGPNAKENIESFTISPEPDTIHQYEEINNDTVSDIATLILSDVLELVWAEVKTLSRWRTADPSNWKKNVAKKRRAEGLSYTTNNQIRAPKVPKTVDCTKCLFKCTDTFTEQDRAKICRTYWHLDFVSKKNFILARITVQPPKKILVERKRPARPYTTKCYFDLGTEKRQVCQKFFCSALGISSATLSDAVKNRDELGFYSGADGRGHHVPPNKTPPEKVQEVLDHISSFPTMEGHYIRKKSKRKYLESTLSVNKMHELYLLEYENNNPVSAITYRRIFSTQFNLSFFVPKKDQCQACNKYTSAQDKDKADLETTYSEHIQRKVACEAEKERDKQRAGTDPTFLSVSFDLQAILQIPCSKVGLLYYVRKLTVYNLTVYESALPNNAFCFSWSEVHGKKGSAEIGTILYHYLSNCISTNVTSVSLFSDTCGGQNRNQNVAAILLWAVNEIDHLQVIEQKFLESGHSYMEADSMHSSIESSKKNKDVFSMTDWKNIFKNARSKGVYNVGKKKVKKDPYNVKEFKYNEFYDLKRLAEAILKNKSKDCNGNKVLWLKIKKMKYVKGDSKIYFNYDSSEDYLNFDTKATATPQSGSRYRTRNQNKSNPGSVEPPPTPEAFLSHGLKKMYDKPLTISAAKKKDLLSLCDKGVIPEEYHGWFRSLNCDNDVIDRVPDVAASESSSDEDDC